jgi:hypothetical protein
MVQIYQDHLGRTCRLWLSGVEYRSGEDVDVVPLTC